MVTINIRYEGEFRCRAIHEPSGGELVTDNPAGGTGKGQSFSPTDLVAAALGTCIITTMAIKAKSIGIDLAGATAQVDKEMAIAPRRIGRLMTTVRVACPISDRHKKVLEATAFSCLVHKSLSHEIEMPIEFRWELGGP
ncbi:MAG TPA: OsmC family protein [Rhizomicrobium sp.]|jgi:putative redox protein